MKKDVTNDDLLKVIMDLAAGQKNIEKKIDETNKKVNRIDNKLTVLSESLLETQTDVKELQSVK